MLLLALASSGFVLQTLSFALPALARAWQVDVAAFSLAFTLHLLGITLGALAFGRLGDRAGRKPLLLVAAALQGITTLACATCSAPWQLAALRLLAGIGVGGISANSVALAVDLAPRQGRTMWTTIVLSGVAVGSSLPALALRWTHGTTATFLFEAGGMATLLLLPVLAVVLPSQRKPHDARQQPGLARGGFATLFGSGLARVTVSLWLAYAGSMMSMHVLTSWLPVLLEAAGHAPARAASLTGWIHGAGVGAVLVSAPLFARFGTRWLALLLLLSFGSVVTMAALGLGAGALDLLVIAFGFGMVGSQSVLGTLAAHLYPEQCRATGVGSAMAAGRLGSMLGPLAGGAIQASGNAAHGMFFVPMCAIAIALFATWGLSARTRAVYSL